MRLPGGDGAIVDLAKLTDYCLSPIHPRGRHKARVFAASLGLDAGHAETLRRTLLELAARSDAAVPGPTDRYGSRYVIDFDCSGPKGTSRVRTAWIVRSDEDVPRFTGCYVL